MIAWVYIVTNKPHGVDHVGVTSDLKGRIAKHKAKHYPNSSITARSLRLRALSRVVVASGYRKDDLVERSRRLRSDGRNN